ncbi:MAG: AMP-binding protein, partial [Planctomycetota bacterium]
MPPGSVHRPILSRLLRYPTRVVAHDDRRSYKGAELIAGAAHIARLVKRTTNAPRVGLMLPTSGAFPIAALGCWWAGRSIVPLNYLLTPDELDYIVRDAEIDLVITAGVLLDATGHEPN